MIKEIEITDRKKNVRELVEIKKIKEEIIHEKKNLEEHEKIILCIKSYDLEFRVVNFVKGVE